MKKNFLKVGISLSMIIGLALSIQTQEAEALEVKGENSINQRSSIPCWSSGTNPLISFRRYVECGSCSSVKGRPTGGGGSCSSGGSINEL